MAKGDSFSPSTSLHLKGKAVYLVPIESPYLLMGSHLLAYAKGSSAPKV